MGLVESCICARFAIRILDLHNVSKFMDNELHRPNPTLFLMFELAPRRPTQLTLLIGTA